MSAVVALVPRRDDGGKAAMLSMLDEMRRRIDADELVDVLVIGLTPDRAAVVGFTTACTAVERLGMIEMLKHDWLTNVMLTRGT